MQQLFALALQHSRNGNTRPSAHHFSNIVGRNLLAHHAFSCLRGLQLLLNALDIVVKLFQLAIPNLGHTFVIALAFGPIGLVVQAFNLQLVLLNLVYQRPFALPFGPECLLLFAQFGYILIQLRHLGLIVFALNGLSFNLQLLKATGYFVQFFGHRVAFHSQFCCRLVHQVDGLVGQKAVGDVAFRQLHGGDTGIVLYAHFVMVLVTLLNATQNGNGAKLIGFVYHHGLEAALQRFVFFEVLLILV